ncbi:hypothetical protein TrRE_jg3712 [Triparma retinervis]|uniref:Uncharacterized protein n=1 Tax=Triparma retinervis TaxID=2557542 RepID=A0A9W7E1S8_9STRA|nr:hypothetical protein TrRE_jg3712 [Triparma retinervis]
MSDADILASCQSRASAVQGMLSGDKSSALSAALSDPPIGSKDMAAKELNGKTVKTVLDAVDEGSIDEVVGKLSDKE